MTLWAPCSTRTNGTLTGGFGSRPLRESRPNFVLDTHTLIYWLGNQKNLSKAQRGLLSAESSETFWISDITFWEVATLYELGRISLHLPLDEWLVLAASMGRFKTLRITPKVAAIVAGLPDSFHRDPADRIIVASAILLQGSVVTSDKRIIQSKLVPTVK